MTRGKPFLCEMTVSTGVREKLIRKHMIEMWELEEVIYDDPHAFAVRYKNCYFVYGRTFAGRYLIVLVRIMSEIEIIELGLSKEFPWMKIITARDMNLAQKRKYITRLRR